MNIESYKHILFAMDLSVESMVMIQRAVNLASIFEADLNIVHVVEPSTKESANSVKDESREMLTNILNPLAIPLSNLHIELGDVQEVILEIVKNKNIDLILIGSHGRKGVSPLLGSTATAVLSSLRCDVLTLSVLRYPKQN
jgi:universal stress protein A